MSLLLLVVLAQPAVGPVVAPPPLPPIPKAAPVSVGTKDLFIVRFEAPKAQAEGDDPTRIQQVARLLRDYRGPLANCYESMLKSRQIVGTAAIDLVIGTDGRVRETRVAENGITDQAVAPCLARVLRRMQLPRGVEEMTVTVPFTFLPAP